MMPHRLVCILGASLMLAVACAPPKDRGQLLTEFVTELDADGIAGRILLAEKGQVFFNESFGLADREKGIQEIAVGF